MSSTSTSRRLGEQQEEGIVVLASSVCISISSRRMRSMRAVLGLMSLWLGCPVIPTYAQLTFLHDQYLEVKREMF
jgi:hypothetical protein